MAKKFLTPIDLNQLELQNARLQNLATAPSSPVKGQVYFNTTNNEALVWNGTAWVPWDGVKKTTTTPKMDGTAAIGSETKYAAGDHVHPTDTSRAPLSSPAFTGTPTAPTATAGNDSTQIATTAFVNSKIWYGTCSTAAATTAKTVTLSGFKLNTGSWVAVKFTVTNTGAVGSLTLNVNSTGAKSIKYRGSNLSSAGVLAANRVYLFVYDGTNYELIGDLDTNTTYSGGTSTELEEGTVTTNRVWQPKILHDYIAGVVGGVDAMRFKGTIGTGGTVTTLPTTDVKVGDTYRVITAGTYAGEECEIGDLIISLVTVTQTVAPSWTVAQTNIDGAITDIVASTEINPNNPISIITYAGSPNKRGISISDATTSASGAMSSSDKTKLNGIATGAEVNQKAFSNVAVSGQTTVAADSKTDTLTLVAGSHIALTTDATNDKVTIATTADPNQNAFSNVKVGNTTVSADTTTDTLELVAGTGVTLTADATNDKITIDASNPEHLVYETTVTIGTTATSTTYTHKEPDKSIEDGKMLLDYTAYMGGAEVVVDHTQTYTAVQESGLTQYYNVTETFSVASSPSSAITIKIHYRPWYR